MSADADKDSHMHSSSSSSSSSENESESLFPAVVDRSTAQNPSGAIFTSELSPPTSQDPADRNGWDSLPDDQMDLETQDATSSSRGKRAGDVVGLSMTALQDDATRGDDVELEPGYAWSNKKAREEYDRAMEHVVDKTFSLREFGDPFGVPITDEIPVKDEVSIKDEVPIKYEVSIKDEVPIKDEVSIKDEVPIKYEEQEP